MLLLVGRETALAAKGCFHSCTPGQSMVHHCQKGAQRSTIRNDLLPVSGQAMLPPAAKRCFKSHVAGCVFEARTGEPRKQNGAERRARGFKRCSAQDRKGDEDTGRTTDGNERTFPGERFEAVMVEPSNTPGERVRRRMEAGSG